MATLHLTIEMLNTAHKGKRFKFKEGMSVGSGEFATLRAKHDELKPVHARFILDNGKAAVEVADQTARISINGRDVLKAELRHNDELVVGPLRFRILDEARLSQPAVRLDALLAQTEDSGGEVYDFAKEDLFYLATKDPSLKQSVNFVIPSKDKFIDQAQSFLSRTVKQSGMDEMQVDAFLTCMKELILNAHRHGHKYDESKRITLRYRDIGSAVKLTIEDQGPGFDHRKVISSSTGKDAASAARERYLAGGFGGLGFQLITKMAQELAYNDPGNVVTFTIAKAAPPDTE